MSLLLIKLCDNVPAKKILFQLSLDRGNLSLCPFLHLRSSFLKLGCDDLSSSSHLVTMKQPLLINHKADITRTTDGTGIAH
jgi:hypothetical protein